jgi:hypothetical protein
VPAAEEDSEEVDKKGDAAEGWEEEEDAMEGNVAGFVLGSEGLD